MARSTPPPTRQPWRQLKSSQSVAWLERVLQQPLIQLVLFVMYVVALVAIMTGGFQLSDASLEPDQIGRIARREIKATRDFVFEERDAEATAQRRQAASERIEPVYDWHEDRRIELRDKVHSAFNAMRKALAAAAPMTKQPVQPTVDPQPEAADQPEPIWPVETESQLIQKLEPNQRVSVAEQQRAALFDPEFPIGLSQEDFELLAREGFSTRHEMLLVGFIDEVMSRMIATTINPIEAHPKQGVVLRRLRGGAVVIEYHMRDALERILAQSDIPELIRASANAQTSEFKDRTTRLILLNLAARLIRPNTEYNETLTQERRAAASRAIEDIIRKETFLKGQLILDRGQRIDARHIRIYQEMMAQDQQIERVQMLVGMVILTLLVLLILYLFGRHNLPSFELETKDYIFLGGLLMLFLGVARMGKWLSYAFAEQLAPMAVQFGIPIAAGAMLVRLMLKTPHAIIFSIVLSMMVGVVLDQPIFIVVYAMLGSLVGIGYVRQVKRRMALMSAGLVIGVTNTLLIAAFLLLRGDLFALSSLWHLAFGMLGGLACGSIILAGLPVFEWSFRYTTDIKLLELSDMNHPLLRELILRAPGSYHHSMMVGSLCEAGAEAIGCNSLLARVGAYYHDIGKAKNPGYFAENQKYGENPHDKLKPNMSALIIKAHVKDGVEMARQHGLPQEIIDFIAQHHGQSLIAYFYHKAKQLEDPDIPEVNEKDYRYPGPKPQTRETAICLLADGIEAASRAMQSPTPAKLKGLVQNMINRAFTDGQLDECDLTLKDLNIIAQAFLRILTGIYHHRPEYPEQKKAAATAAAPAKETKTQPNPAVTATNPAVSQEHAKSRRPHKQTPGLKHISQERPAVSAQELKLGLDQPTSTPPATTNEAPGVGGEPSTPTTTNPKKEPKDHGENSAAH